LEKQIPPLRYGMTKQKQIPPLRYGMTKQKQIPPLRYGMTNKGISMTNIGISQIKGRAESLCTLRVHGGLSIESCKLESCQL
jgi:hypothetical protein